MHVTTKVGLEELGGSAPQIERPLHLNFVGDWGQANFHRVCAWLTQEICDRAGRGSTIATHSLYDGGLGSIQDVYEGKRDLCIATPAGLCAAALTGDGPFSYTGPMPTLRSIGSLPQRDRMIFAVDPKYEIRSWADVHRTRPPLRIAISSNDGTCFMGFLAIKYLEAHGLTKELLESWGGALVECGYRPEQCTDVVVAGKANALLQEAILTPWWTNLIEKDLLFPISADPAALEKLRQQTGLQSGTTRPEFWKKVRHELTSIDFSDFIIIVNSSMPDDIAYLITWVFINTRLVLESRYKHIAAERSPIGWPLDPKAMAQTTLPLHPGAKQFYKKASLL